MIYAGDWPGWLFVLLIVIGVSGIGLMMYRRRANTGSPTATTHYAKLAVVAALQVAMLMTIVWVLRQPTLSTEQLRAGENSVAFALDTSQSMSYGESESRLASAVRAFAAATADDSALNLGVQLYEMSDRARRVESFLSSEALGTQTALLASVTDVLREARFSPLAAIVLASDGADTGGGLTPAALGEVAAFGVPVHTIGVGRELIPEDLELVDLVLPEKTLPGSSITARLSIRHDAPANTRIKVYNDDLLLESQPLELRPGSQVTTAWVNVRLEEAGHHHLRFSIDALNGERELRNNSRSALVEVADDSYRVLYFEGEPRWEYKFMRRALGDDEDLQLASLLRVSPNKFYRQGIDSPDQLEDGFPTQRSELFAYDALIIGSVEAASLSESQIAMIHDFVSERGGSLLMIAGPNGLGNGGWGQSGIASVLPARLPGSSTNSFFRKKAGVELTPHGADEQMLRLADESIANGEKWAALPEIADYQLTGSLRPAAIVLLNAQTDKGDIPLLIGQQFGRGHAYILATGGTWRWQMSMPVEDQSHETFWRQLLRTLVSQAPNNVSLTAGAGDADSAVRLRAEFRDAAFAPLDDIAVTAIVTHQSGETFSTALAPAADDRGVFLAEVPLAESGTWYFEAIAERNGEPVGVARSSMHFEAGQEEYFGFRRDNRNLERLSQATGGQHLGPGDIDALPELLRYSSSGITETDYRPIWDAPAIFLLLLLLKGGEWLLRRRWSTI